MARRPTPRKQAKLNVNYMRAMSQAQALYHERDLGRFVTFEQLLKEVGVNYKAKTVTEQNLKRLNKLATLKGIYGATSARHLRKRTTAEWYEKQGILQEEYKQARNREKYKDKDSIILRSTVDDYRRYLQYWDKSLVTRNKSFADAYNKHLDIINELEYAITEYPEGHEYRVILASYIAEFTRTHGAIDVENLYQEIPLAHYYIIENFKNSYFSEFKNIFE